MIIIIINGIKLESLVQLRASRHNEAEALLENAEPNQYLVSEFQAR
jgi:hypothetical protein